MTWVEVFFVALFGAFTGSALGMMVYAVFVMPHDMERMARVVADMIRQFQREP